MGIPCAKCGVEHDLEDLEPSFARPESIDRVPAPARETRAVLKNDFASLTTGEVTEFFVRALAPVRVRGRADPICWGIWTRVSQTTFHEIRELWDDPDQLRHGPWPAAFANELAKYEPTLDLSGSIRFVDTKQIPHFAFDDDVTHRFAEEMRTGVSLERVAEWQSLLLHDEH